LDPQPISLVTIVEAAVDQVRGKIESAGLDFRVSLPSIGVPVVADSIRLQQVLTRILTNAVKFTPRGGASCVNLTTTDTDSTGRVADTGRGISAEMVPHIFEPFRQGQETRRQSTLGLGLDLRLRGISSTGTTA
jgi:signal transduction histidine kinase